MIRALALALALAACGPAIPPVPGKGGPAWRELTSEHFTLWTDTSESRAREQLRDMENLRHVVIGMFRGGGEGRVFVIMLRDIDEARAFMPGEFTAMASEANSKINQPVIMLGADAEREVVTHELTHTISQTVIPVQPRWFAEGIAKYFETIQMDRDKGKVDLGRAPTYEGQPMVISRPASLRELVACKDLRPSCADRHFYAGAWAVFTFLMNTKPGDMRAYIPLLEQANLDELDAEMKRWIVNGSHNVLHFDVKFPPYTVAVKTLTDADVYAARALLRLEFQERGDLAKLEAQQAIALDPTHVLAHFIVYRVDKTIAVDTARALVKAHPDDWRAQMMLAQTLHTGEEAHQAYLRGCELAAQNPALFVKCDAK